MTVKRLNKEMSVKGLGQRLACNTFSEHFLFCTAVIFTPKMTEARKGPGGSWDFSLLA